MFPLLLEHERLDSSSSSSCSGVVRNAPLFRLREDARDTLSETSAQRKREWRVRIRLRRQGTFDNVNGRKWSRKRPRPLHVLARQSFTRHSRSLCEQSIRRSLCIPQQVAQSTSSQSLSPVPALAAAEPWSFVESKWRRSVGRQIVEDRRFPCRVGGDGSASSWGQSR